MCLGENEVPYNKGTITVIPKNFPHHTVGDDSRPQKWEYLFVDEERLLKSVFAGRSVGIGELIRKLNSQMLIIQQGENEQITWLVRALLEEMREKRRLYKEAVNGELLALLLAVARLKPEQFVIGDSLISDKNLEYVLSTVEYIEQHYMDKLDVGQLVKLSHMSESHFRRKFKEYMNISPGEYINFVRIQKACELLAKSDDSIKHIGIQCGFQEATAFIRNFKKFVGQVPQKWRQAAKSEINNPANYKVSVLKGW